MTRDACGRILPVLPEWIRGDLEGEKGGDVAAEAVERHLEGCAGCRAEAELLRTLVASRPEPPPGLAGRVKESLRASEAASGPIPPRPRSRHAPRTRDAPLRRVAAVAALLVLAATAVLLPGREGAGPEGDGPELALESVPDVWLSDDGVVAGAPLLGELSREELETLLEEMER